MSAISITGKFGFAGFGKKTRLPRKTASLRRSVLGVKRSAKGESERAFNREKEGKPLGKAIFFLAASTAIFGIFYLYQVNGLAAKGYEMKEVENRIAELKKENEKNKIQEVELRSMYNIEKITNDLDLISSNNISYLELSGPIAMIAK